MKVNGCKMGGVGGRGVDDGDEDSPLKTEERLDLIPALDMSSWYGRWPIGDRPRERIFNDSELALRFSRAGGPGDGVDTGARGTSGTGSDTD